MAKLNLDVFSSSGVDGDVWRQRQRLSEIDEVPSLC